MRLIRQGPTHLLEILALITLLCELRKGHVEELEQHDWRYAGGGLVHGLVQITEG